MLCSESKAKNFSIDLLLCPMVHNSVSRVLKATTHLVSLSKFHSVPFHFSSLTGNDLKCAGDFVFCMICATNNVEAIYSPPPISERDRDTNNL